MTDRDSVAPGTRETIRAAVVALLSILAVALAAATLDSTLLSPGGGSGGSGGLGGQGEGGLPISPPSEQLAPGEAIRIPYLSEIILVLAILAAIAVLVYLYYNWRDALRTVAVLVVLFVALYLLFRLLGEAGLSLDVFGGGAPGATPGTGGDGSASGGSGPDRQPPLPSLMLLVVLALALAGAIVAVFRSTPEPDEEESSAPVERPSETAAVGRAAGRAADRLEAAEGVDNEVYRAWREMTALLDVPDPETSTPGEFADAAVAAGIDRDDVAELTRLFEDVRYGDREPSADHEERAIEIFRRIEDRYAEGGS